MTICINSNTSNSNDELFCQTCGSLLLIKERYRPIRQLGTGGFGTTYEIMDLQDQSTKKVLKVLRNNSEKAIDLFRREARFLASNNHPGIPKADSNAYFQFEPKDSRQPLHCLVMEKIKGVNLKEYIDQLGRPIKGDVGLRWFKELVNILDLVHSQEIIHRDIKPRNIMYQPNGKLVLIDFGAVTDEGIIEGTETATHAAGGTRVYTKGYASPEQIEGRAIKRSDIYSLGRTFVYLLTGKEPNDPVMYDVLNDQVNWREYARGVSSEFADLIDAMIKRVPNQRPANTHVILQKLQQMGGVAKRGEDIEINLGISEVEAAAGTPKKSVNVSRWINVNGNLQQETKQLTVTIPAGVREGQKMRLQGQGNAGKNGGENGDVYVRLSVYETAPVTDNTEQGNVSELESEYAPLWKRFFAGVIDLIIAFVCGGAGFFLIYNTTLYYNAYSSGFDERLAWFIAILSVLIYYSIEFFTKSSLGKLIFRIKIVPKNKSKISFGASCLRIIVKIISIFPGFLIPFIAIFFNKNQQGLHDMIAGTIVVKK